MMVWKKNLRRKLENCTSPFKQCDTWKSKMKKCWKLNANELGVIEWSKSKEKKNRTQSLINTPKSIPQYNRRRHLTPTLPYFAQSTYVQINGYPPLATKKEKVKMAKGRVYQIVYRSNEGRRLIIVI